MSISSKKFTVFRFHFKAPLHISNIRADYGKSESILHSDTLYAAIYQAWAKMGLENLIPESGNPTFTLSSMFPFYQKNDETPIYFFPKPFYAAGKNEALDTSERKKLKKIQFYDKVLFEQLLNTGSIDFPEKIEGKFASQSSFESGFIYSKVRTRAKVNQTEETKPYAVDQLFFKDHSGYYTIVDTENEEDIKNIHSALNLLGDEGIGTDRSVGFGHFELSKNTIELKLPKSDYVMHLSLYLPSSEHIVQSILSNENYFGYDLIKRGGRITDEGRKNMLKNDVYFFNTGSVFKNIDSGKTVDLMPDKMKEISGFLHPVYRVGKSLQLPIKILQ